MWNNKSGFTLKLRKMDKQMFRIGPLSYWCHSASSQSAQVQYVSQEEGFDWWEIHSSTSEMKDLVSVYRR